MTVLQLTVDGLPAPQGSHRIGRNRRTGKPIILADNDETLRAWRLLVTTAARRARVTAHHHTVARDVPVAVSLTFAFPRLKSHYRTGAHSDELRTDAPLLVVTKPDVDKLTRAVLDGLTDAAVWTDDSQVQLRGCAKIYGEPGVQITVEHACRYCGCTDLAGCDADLGALGLGCGWIEPGVCSRCRA